MIDNLDFDTPVSYLDNHRVIVTYDHTQEDVFKGSYHIFIFDIYCTETFSVFIVKLCHFVFM